MELFHLSHLNNLSILIPRVPVYRLRSEENTTPRVSFSSSILGAIRALPDFIIGSKLYVYQPVNAPTNLVNNDKLLNMVPDCEFTGEVWVLDEIRVICTGYVIIASEPITIAIIENEVEEIHVNESEYVLYSLDGHDLDIHMIDTDVFLGKIPTFFKSKETS